MNRDKIGTQTCYVHQHTLTHATVYVQCMYYAHTFKMKLRVISIYMYMYCIERSVNISIAVITSVNNICFVMLLLTMISLHMLTFRLMVTMVAH